MKRVKVSDMTRGYTYIFITDHKTMEELWEEAHNEKFYRFDGHIENKCVFMGFEKRLENGNYIVPLHFIKEVDSYDMGKKVGKMWMDEPNHYITKELSLDDEVVQMEDYRIMYVDKYGKGFDYVVNPESVNYIDVTDIKALKKSIDVWTEGEMKAVLTVGILGIILSIIGFPTGAGLAMLMWIYTALYIGVKHSNEKHKKLCQILAKVAEREKRRW